MKKQKLIVVRTERLPHRHAVVCVRSAFRQLRQMHMKTDLADINNRNSEQIVQEKKS